MSVMYLGADGLTAGAWRPALAVEFAGAVLGAAEHRVDPSGWQPPRTSSAATVPGAMRRDDPIRATFLGAWPRPDW
jgi:hypothetical protein